MNDPFIEEVKVFLKQATENGQFFSAIYESLSSKGCLEEDVKKIILELHKEESIDVLNEFKKNQEGVGRVHVDMSLFMFENMLPELESKTQDVLSCLSYLCSLRTDNRENIGLLESFESFCRVDEKRCSEALDMIEKGDVVNAGFLTCAIKAGARHNLNHFVNRAIALTKHENKIIVAEAIHTLRLIEYHNDKALIKQVLNVIKDAVKLGYEANIFSKSMITAVYLIDLDRDLNEEFEKIVEIILTHRTRSVIDSIGDVFFVFPEKIPDTYVKIFSNILFDDCKSNDNILTPLNNGLSKLLSFGKIDVLIDILEDAIVVSDINAEKLCDFISRSMKDVSFWGGLVTRWLLLKKYKLLNAVTSISQITKQNMVFDFNYEVFLGLNGDLIFIVKKSIGCLYQNPIAMLRFIASLMDRANKAEKEEIKNILLTPLLINPQDINQCLSERGEGVSSGSKKILNSILKDIENYNKEIKSMPVIKELVMPLPHMETYYRFEQEMLFAIHREAIKKSVFSRAAKKVTLLYGAEAINYVGPTNHETRHVISMKARDYVFSMPTWTVFNPHGLQYMLNDFLMEGINI